MNIPNIISIFRLLLIIPISYFFIINNYIIALILLFVAWISDLLDGYLARRLNQVSELGKTLDPLADKLLVFVIVLYLILTKKLPLLVASVVVARDVLILLAGFLAYLRFKYVIPSNYIGKISAFLIGLILIIILFFPNSSFVPFLEIFLIIVCLISLILYSLYYVETIKKLKNK